MTQNWPSTVGRRERRENRHAVVALAARLRPESDCIDIGAHKGGFLQHMVRLHELAARAYGTAPGNVHDALAAAGLRVFDLDGGGPYTRAEFERLTAHEPYWNWLCC